MPSLRRGLRHTSYALVLVTLAACGLGKSNQDGVCRETGASSAAISGFSSKVHPLFATFQCNGCHVSGGAGSGAFADPSASTAFNAAKRLVSLASPESSLIVGKLRSGHQCGAIAQCNDQANQLADAIRNWSAESGGPSALGGCQGRGTKVVLAAKSFSIGSLDPATDTLLTWRVADFQGAIPGDVWFRIAVKQLTPPQGAADLGSALFSKPQLLSNTKKYRITNISFIRNGVQAPDLVNFLGTTAVIAPDPTNGNSNGIWPVSVASSANQIALGTSADESYGIQFFLEESQDAPGQEFSSGVPACVAFTKYDTDVSPTLSGRCFACHANAGSTAHRSYPMTGSKLDVCMETKLRTDMVNYDNSKVLRKAAGADGHQNLNISSAERTKILQWIGLEANGG